MLEWWPLSLLFRFLTPPLSSLQDNTPLIIAAYCGHTEVVRLLLEAGADKMLKNEVRWRGDE